MPPREQRYSASTRRGERLLLLLGEEVRHARVALGLTQRQLGHSARMSQTRISRIEAGRLASLSFLDAARVTAATGLDLSVKSYPSVRRPRDAGQLKRLEALLANVRPPLTYRLEAPLPSTGPLPEQRAWDAMVEGGGEQTAVELEVRLHDIQAQLRRILLKKRDGQPDRLLIVVADTRANRRVLAEHGGLLAELPRQSVSTVLDALRQGRHPPSGIVLV